MVENHGGKPTEELDSTSFLSRDISVDFPSSETRMVNISCYLHSKQVMFPLFQSIDQGEQLKIGYRVPVLRIFLVLHSTQVLDATYCFSGLSALVEVFSVFFLKISMSSRLTKTKGKCPRGEFMRVWNIEGIGK